MCAWRTAFVRTFDSSSEFAAGQFRDLLTRELVRRMNITLVEPENTRTKSTCCGDIFWGTLGTKEVMEQMRKKASEMPVEEVAVYCVSCVKAMFVGGKSPRYLVDLMFGEETVPQTTRPDLWHQELDKYIDSHT